MKIKYWTNFSKRKNSTKQPTSGTEIDVYLKDDTSLINPTFDCASVAASANYIYCSDFGRYYFVRDVVRSGKDRVLLYCEVDVLASYKSAIGSYSGFIEYASSSTQTAIQDPRNHPTSLMTANASNLTITSSPFSTVGCYVVGVLSDDASGAGGVLSYYAMDAGELMFLSSELNDQNIWDQIMNQFTAAQDSLVSCIWIPISKSAITGTQGAVHIGRTTLQLTTGKKITDRTIDCGSGSTTIPYASFSGGAGSAMKYLDCAPYTSVMLYLPFVGLVPGNVEIAAFTKLVQLDIWIDVLSGDIVYKVRYGGEWTSTFNGNIATKIPVSSATYDGVGVATGALAVIGGAVGLGVTIATEGGAAPLVGAAGAMVSGAVSAAKSAEFHTMINGAASSALGAELGITPFVIVNQYVPAMTNIDDIKAELGLPYFAVNMISNMSGFVKMLDASVSIAGTSGEKDMVDGFLNSGFYYE